MKPAIFNTDMVRAILSGSKTQTRRKCKVQPNHKDVYADQYNHNPMQYAYWALDNRLHDYLEKTPYQKGDIIYVRETFAACGAHEDDKTAVFYKADEQGNERIIKMMCDRWYPSIHMPKEYARLFLRVKDVRIERLNEISEEDAISEGVISLTEDDGTWYHDYINGIGFLFKSAKRSFQTLWDSIYGRGSFNDDYVWVIEFEKITKEEAENAT